MNITTPIQPNVPQPQEKNDVFLRVNQRVAGEILNIANDQVVLSINGVPIVAQMTSSEQLAMLADRRFAYFVVKDIGDKVVTLQLANIESGTPQKATIPSNLNSAILSQIGMPDTEENSKILQAALSQGLQVTPELIDEMKTVLNTIPGWSSKEAQIAAAIKFAGLPLSEGSLELALNSIKNMTSNFELLSNQLQNLVQKYNLPPNIFRSINNTLNLLQEIIIRGNDSTQQLFLEVQESIKNLGTSLERNLETLINPELKESSINSMSHLLMNLVNLKKEFNSFGLQKFTTEIDNFIDGARWMQFLNAKVEQPVGKGQWTQIDLPIMFDYKNSIQNQNENIHNLKIRIAQENEPNGNSIVNPNYTRLVINVDLNEKDSLKVDLSIVSKQVGAEIIASNNDICISASEELDDFKTGLEKLGYTLRTSKIEIGDSKLEMDIKEDLNKLQSFSSIDLGI